MKKTISLLLALALALSLTACGETEVPETGDTEIILSDEQITVNGKKIAKDGAVYAAHDIVYYEDGHDFTYGEGEEKDAHSAEEAAGHTVVHITKPGTYILRGSLSAGQIAVDLGEEAESDSDAVVTLVLDGVDLTCAVAPAIIFYRVYECGDKENPTQAVDTTAAGANILLAEGTENTVNGSYVARIYKSVTLSADGTKVEESKKLHKYDGAVYSKMSMNIGGEGVLHVNAENEGIDSEMHLTVNGGTLHIVSGDDGINTNEDNVSVTTVNGGLVDIRVTGDYAGEGDGIDSNGYLVINGGTVMAAACGFSQDSGIDSDCGIYLNGGTVISSGHMLDALQGAQTYAVFTFRDEQQAGQTYTLKNADGASVLDVSPANAFTMLVVSSPELVEGEYSLWQGEKQLNVAQGGMAGAPGMEPPEKPEGDMMPGEMIQGKIELPPELRGEETEVPMKPREGQMPQEGIAIQPGEPGQPGQPGEPMPRPENVPENAQAEYGETFLMTFGGNFFTVE